MALWQLLFFFLHGRLVDSMQKPDFEPGVTQLGIGNFVEAFAGQLSSALVFGFQFVVLVLFMALLFRRDRVAFVIGGFVFVAALALLGGGALFNWLNASVTGALITIALYRYGLLTMLASIFSIHLYIQFPVTANLTSWYATGFLLALIIFVAVAVFSFRASLAGQPLYGRKLLED